ncbi:MAG: prolipoprotein diacylglyceryl transferase, partial [Ruminococcus sp.]|nr:prolipoprotein diacylglyceryl transferase [Candidatus Apopatosoma intestinale]
VCAHPTFLYESLWNVIGFILINIFYKKKKYNGQIFLAYMGWYGLGRMFIEGLRSDSLWLIPGRIRVSQLLAFLLFVASATLLVILNVRWKKLVHEGALTENSVADVSVLFGIRKPKSHLTETGEVEFNTEEFERLNAIEDSEAKRKAMAKNPFVPTSEFDAVKEESPADASDKTEKPEEENDEK